MPSTDFSDIRAITDFPSLIRYLRTDLGWPVDEEQVDDLTFEYRPAELGIEEGQAVNIREIKQLRPLAGNQPWGIFWIDFEPKKLPVTVMRRILAALVRKQRGQASRQATWNLRDLMFISATGSGSQRGISFAHFREDEQGRPRLFTFSWDVRESHLYYITKLNLGALKWPQDPNNAQAWREQWSAAFCVQQGYVPQTAEMLAQEMARIAGDIREAVAALYEVEHVGGPLRQLHLSLKMSLISDLDPAEFADMYAQTVTYGLFAARATRSGEFAVERPHPGPLPQGEGGKAESLISHSNPFLRELLEQLILKRGAGQPPNESIPLDLDELGVEELAGLLRKVDMEAILMDFNRQKRGEDPVIHFYETFMKYYDPKQKARRGEFYTPDPVVSFIVRSVDHLLRTQFGCENGLADIGSPSPKFGTNSSPEFGRGPERGFSPVILDPATGTGTFLRYVILVIWETFYRKHKGLGSEQRKAKWNAFARERLLPNLYGFELKMSPYTIAHLKLGLTLQEFGFTFGDDERLRVYLSNALQPAHEVARVDTPALAHEVEKANEVKARVPVTVVIGNPPYSGHSANASKHADGSLNFIGSLLQDYYRVDGKPLGEKNPKWLQDDYVKFLRFAQWRVNTSGAGIVAMITNHGFLDNPTFRGMRQQLMQTFSEIYVLDLHGNSKKKETAPDGSKDENVFDIMQGVAICLMVKKPGATGSAKVFHADLFGLREFKYEWLMAHHSHIGSVEWSELKPQTPFYIFMPQNANTREEYEHGWPVSKIFPLNNLGMNTHRDEFVIDFERDALYKRISDFRNSSLSDEAVREKYTLPDNRDWKLTNARRKLQADKNWERKFITCLYRPFDFRWLFYSQDLLDYPRPVINEHMIAGKNISFATTRQTREPFSVIATDHVCGQHKIATPYDGSNIFPLYTYFTPKTTFGTLFQQDHTTRTSNLAQPFIQLLATSLDLQFVTDGRGNLATTFGPEDVFHYIYAIFHSPTYRSRYAEFLKIDFPRLPLTSNAALFRQLCGLGAQLVGLHLLESPLLDKAIFDIRYSNAKSRISNNEYSNIEYSNNEYSNIVEKGYPKYTDGKVYINSAACFAGIPEETWNFHIGGYQVCEKWLKDRRGRELSSEDVDHYQKIVIALGETTRQMGLVDAAIESAGGWPVR